MYRDRASEVSRAGEGAGKGDPHTHLSLIETRWSLIVQAHQDRGDTAADARKQLMGRYFGAVERYLLRVTRDPDLAADLAQEFAVRFLRGDFSRVDPQRGRFRDYVKRAAMNLVIDAQRRQRIRPQSLPEGGWEASVPALDLTEHDQQFLDCWRDTLLSSAWERMAEYQESVGQPFHTVLRLKVDHPDLHSPRMAEILSEQLGKEVNAGWVRQVLYRAREKFIEFLQKEVSHSLGNVDADQRDEEMRNLGLWVYCRTDRKREKAS